MRDQSTVGDTLDLQIKTFYQRGLRKLTEARIPFLVGGAYALAHYTGIIRHTKDFDIFVKAEDSERTLETLAQAGYLVERTFPHWLGKAFSEVGFFDVIHSSGNGVATVDQAWLDHAEEAVILDQTLKLCPVEEIIWSKSFVMERERYDGADIAHLLRVRGAQLDWKRLVSRFGPHWRVLLSYLVLFGFIYPGERSTIPSGVMAELIGRLQDEQIRPCPDERICQGTVLSREQFLFDIETAGYRDARLEPLGSMSAEAIHHWTAAIYS
jgi:hypothetical protein